MNFIHKYILPLLDKRLTLNDISFESGFCGLATYDINRPYLDKHIFLIYSMAMNNKAIAVRKKLAGLGITNKIDCKIKGESYRIFCFPIVGNTIINLMSNILSLTDEQTLQVYKFWKFTDDDINQRMLNISYFPENFKETGVPEFDFSPKDFISTNEKGQALVFQRLPFICFVIYMNVLDRVTNAIRLQTLLYLLLFQKKTLKKMKKILH